MTKEDIQILLVDLCARLPYKVKVVDDMGRVCTLTLSNVDLCSMFYGEDFDQGNTPSICKPYLRSMSSMTEEEKRKLQSFYPGGFGSQWFDIEKETIEIFECPSTITLYLSDNWQLIDYLNSIHVDYRGLIPRGLALPAKKGMYQ